MSAIKLSCLSGLMQRLPAQACSTSLWRQHDICIRTLQVSVQPCISTGDPSKLPVLASVISQLNLKLLNRQPIYAFTRGRELHTSQPRYIHPALLLLIKPVARVASVITGRLLRNWWKRLPDEHRAHYRRRILERRPLLGLVGLAFVIAGFIHYFTHITETPVTKRRRYLAFTQQQFLQLAEYEYNLQLTEFQSSVVLPTHPVYKQVSDVVQKIVNANQDLEFMRQQTWTLLVIDKSEINAFVLPTGHIFVFTGLLKVAENDNQLAVVLGHEMAHALLSHAAETVSFATILDVAIIIAMAAIWTFMPTDGIAIITQWFYNKVIKLMLDLPYTRKLEEEADEVGLQLIAKACYDVRESSAFWNKMTLRAQLSDDPKANVELPEWLSTHPTNENRASKLDTLIPAASELRLKCNCPALPVRDPRSSVDFLRQLVTEKKSIGQSPSELPVQVVNSPAMAAVSKAA